MMRKPSMPTRRHALFGAGCAAGALVVGGPVPASAKQLRADVTGLVHSVAAASAEPGQPAPALRALDTALNEAVGHKLFTVLVLNLDKGENQRYYTNQPQAYPTGASKPIVRRGEFFTQVVEAGHPRICYNYDDVKRAFFDHELIRSLGCESAVNVPIRFDGRTIGTLNLLHEANWYSEADLPVLATFAALATAPVMEIIRTWKS